MINIMRIVYLIFTLIIFQTFAQTKFKITGQVQDENKKPLIGATVYNLETKTGTITNFNSTFEFPSLDTGQYTLMIALLGFKTDTLKLDLIDQSLNLNLTLQEQAARLADLEIVGERITERTSISNIAFGAPALQTTQGLIEDPLRSVAALPGIARGGDLFVPSLIYVRGGAPSETLFLLDSNKIYFPYYFGGQKSIFNTEVIERLELLTGGFSAAYGNHLSSVLNVQTRDGNFKRYSGSVALGFYNSSGRFEGPLIKDKLSILIAPRRTYLDLFRKGTFEFPVPAFGDVTYKITYKINRKHKLSLSGLVSDESIDFLNPNPNVGESGVLKTAAQNNFQSLQLKSAFSSKFYNKLSVVNALGTSKATINSNRLRIEAWNIGLRDDLTYYISNKHKLKTGIEWQYRDFNGSTTFYTDPFLVDRNDTAKFERTERKLDEEGEVLRSAYILYDGNPFKRWGINVGVRADQNPRNSEHAFTVSPRLALNYQLSSKSKIRLATGLYQQFLDNENKTLKSNKALHYILGYEYRFKPSLYGWVEAYYKDYFDLLIYDGDLNYSNGGVRSVKGLELFLRKTKGNVRGWIAYTLSHSQRTISPLNEVKDFNFDQRHILNIVLEFYIREDIRGSLPAQILINFRYASGRPYTPPVAAVNTPDGWQPIMGEALSARDPAYVNLNLRMEWPFKGKKFKGASFMEIWNFLNWKNVQGRVFEYGTRYPNNINVREYYTRGFTIGGGVRFEFGRR